MVTFDDGSGSPCPSGTACWRRCSPTGPLFTASIPCECQSKSTGASHSILTPAVACRIPKSKGTIPKAAAPARRATQKEASPEFHTAAHAAMDLGAASPLRKSKATAASRSNMPPAAARRIPERKGTIPKKVGRSRPATSAAAKLRKGHRGFGAPFRARAPSPLGLSAASLTQHG